MTLIITELSPFGIVMVGDTAQTVDSLNADRTIGERAFFGLIKVIPVPKLNAGLAYWGWTKMPPNDEDHGVWMDWWLRDLVDKRQADYNTLEDLAKLLETELRIHVPRLTEPELVLMPTGDGGIHLAGFVEAGKDMLPCFWHIHNGRSQRLPDKQIDPCIVNANCDCPPIKLEEEASYITRNGDIEAYVGFFERHLRGYTQELSDELGILVPFPTLGSRAEYWSAQIRFISALYEASGVMEEGTLRRMIKGIGDQVTTLTIVPTGIVSYFTR